MTSLTAPAPIAAASPATAATPPVFGARIIIGLVGVLLAVLVSGLNEMVTKVALADIRGALNIGYDEGTWLVACYAATSVAAMAFAPWCSVTFSLRRFTLCAISLFTLLGVAVPVRPELRKPAADAHLARAGRWRVAADADDRGPALFAGQFQTLWPGRLRADGDFRPGPRHAAGRLMD